MTSCTGSSGTIYAPVGAPFARGGEGALFRLQGKQDKVAKILSPPHRTDERHQKLAAMVAACATPATMQCAWPTDLLYVGSTFVGYVMPRVDGCGLRQVYAYGKRGARPWRYFIIVARNLAAAVDNFHQAGQVVGDLNPDNILVHPVSGVVTLVDTDSYHVQDSVGHVYRCGVGKPEFVAPELQGIHFPTAQLPTFTRETDRFSLAVLIFMILMNGAHPHACRPGPGVSGSLLQPIENMKKGISPYFAAIPVRGIDIPAYAPSKDVLSPRVQELFDRAFSAGHRNPSMRPSGSEWHEALGELTAQLSTCRLNSEHQFCSTRRKCPWCEVDERMAALIGRPAASVAAAATPTAVSSPHTARTTVSASAPRCVPKPAAVSSGTSAPRTSPPVTTVYRSPMRRLFDRWWRAARANLTAATLGVVLLGAAVVGSGMLGPLWAVDDGSASGDGSAAASPVVSTASGTPLAVADGWVYYSCGDMYRIRTDGTGQSILYRGVVGSVVAAGDAIFFRASDETHDGGLFKMNAEGTQVEFLAGEGVDDIKVVGDWVYFDDSGTGHSGLGLSRVRVDGTELTTLSTTDMLPCSFGSSMTISDYEVAPSGIVYFLHKGNLYRMPNQPGGGAESTLVMKGMSGSGGIYDIARDEDYLYVVGHGGADSADDDLLGRMPFTDPSNYEVCDLTPGGTVRLYREVELLAAVDGSIYYKYEETSGQTLGRLSLATGETQPLVEVAGEGQGARAVVEGEWIYYGGLAATKFLRKIRIDGTGDQLLVSE